MFHEALWLGRRQGHAGLHRLNPMKKFLAIDISPERGKAFLGGVGSQGVDMEEVWAFPVRKVDVMGGGYWDFLAIYQNVVEALRRVAGRGVMPDSIGIDTFGFDFCCFGADGRLLSNPFAFTSPMAEASPSKHYSSVQRANLYKVTASQDLSCKTLFQLDAMQRMGCSSLAVVDKILFLADSLAYLLTGEMATEMTMAATSGLVNIYTRGLEPKILMSIGLSPRQFGSFVEPTAIVGHLSDSVRRLCDLPAVPVVAVASHEVASSLVSLPADEPEPAYIHLGNLATVGIETDSPVINPGVEAANVSNAYGPGGKNEVQKVVMGLRLLQSCRDEWGADVSLSDEQAMVRAAKNLVSIVDPDSPSLANAPQLMRALAEECSATSQRPPSTREEFARCVYSSMANKYAEVLRSILIPMRRSVARVFVCGPGAGNAQMCQCIADALDLPVVAVAPESAAAGNLLTQAMAAGEVRGLGEARRLMVRAGGQTEFRPGEG